MKNETPVTKSFFDAEQDKKSSGKNIPIMAKEYFDITTNMPTGIQGDLFDAVQKEIDDIYRINAEGLPNINALSDIGGVKTKYGFFLQGIEKTITMAIWMKAYKENTDTIRSIKNDYIKNVDRSIDYSKGKRIGTTITITGLMEEICEYKNAKAYRQIKDALDRIVNRWIIVPKTNNPNETVFKKIRPLEVKDWEFDAKNNEHTIYIEFSSLFTYNLLHRFIKCPENIVPFYRYLTSQYISSGIEINIFDYLYQIIHYDAKRATNPFAIEKKKLFDIAINFEKEQKTFRVHPERREQRFRSLITKFVKVGFLTIGTHIDKDGKEIEDLGYWETTNSNGFPVCNFRLNFDFVNTLNNNEILNIIQNEKRKKLQ